MTSLRGSFLLARAHALMGCGDRGDGPRDSMVGGPCGDRDGRCPDDAARVDTGATDTDSGLPGTDAGTTDTDAGIACAGIECADYAATLATQPRGASSLDNCVIQLHQADCCGATDAYGINHAARTALCAAEATCVAGYPDPICSDTSVTTDTGETTMNRDDVRVRLVAGICETFVCTTGACRSAPGIAGGCSP